MRDLPRLADEDLRDALRMVEADERVRDHELALREAGAVIGQRHGWLQLRDEVVAEVADDRHVERLRLLERHDAGARADEREAPEPPALHRLEQEARST